jgi:hypothetical protein
LLSDAESTFQGLATEYAKRKDTAESLVSEWRWATEAWFDPRPLWFERHGDTPGRPLKSKPARLVGRVESGLDALNRVVAERLYNEHGFYETFYRWTEERIESAHYDYHSSKRPINCTIVERVRQVPTRSTMAAIDGVLVEAYTWDGPRIAEIHVRHAERLKGALSLLRLHHVARMDYSVDGQMERVALHWPPAPPRQPEPVVQVVFEHRGA